MNTHTTSGWTTLRYLVVLLAAGGVTTPDTAAAARAVYDVHVTRVGSTVAAEIAFGCPMRYLDHTPQLGGPELRIRLSLDESCKTSLGTIYNELHRPQAGHLADMVELEFDSTSPGRASIVLRFEHMVGFQVSQGADFRILRVQIQTDLRVEAQAPPLEPPPVVAAPAPPPPAPAASDRRPIRLVHPLPSNQSLFAIRLVSFLPQDEIDRSALQQFHSHTVYTTDVAINGQEWKELRVGFFATEAEAQAELYGISDDFPAAWVAIATPEEQTWAGANKLDTATMPETVLAAQAIATPPQNADARSKTMSDERVTELLAEAKSAMLSRDYDRSIKIYTRLLQEPGGAYRLEAREYLGVAREKNGQFAHARAEYEAFLVEFPEGADARRVEQRLAALAAKSETPRDTLRAAQERPPAEWDFRGTASQSYLRGAIQMPEDDSETVSQSALLSQADLTASRRGETTDLLARANVAYLFDFFENSPEDQGLISFAYLDIARHDLNLRTRLGRQTRYTGGVLGRFDGAHLSYGWRPNVYLNLTTGFPVDSARYVPNTDRYFYGASVDVENVADTWDFSVFTNFAQVDGISDREAFGAEVQYHDHRLNLVGLVDYDASYDVLNTALAIGNWRVNDRLTVNGRYDFGAGPFLTTSNALIGQPVTRVETLLEVYSEPQVRRLARNRTDQVQHHSVGFSAILTQRWQLNADFGYGENEGTVMSGGVPAVPRMGPEYFYRADFVGSSIFRPRDTAIFGLRYTSNRTYDTSTAVFDMRIPIGDGLRINPRLAVSLREIQRDDTEQWIASPMLRLLYRWRSHYRVELEVGGEWSSRDLPPDPMMSPMSDDEEEISAYYVNLGYWMDF